MKYLSFQSCHYSDISSSMTLLIVAHVFGLKLGMIFWRRSISCQDGMFTTLASSSVRLSKAAVNSYLLAASSTRWVRLAKAAVNSSLLVGGSSTRLIFSLSFIYFTHLAWNSFSGWLVFDRLTSRFIGFAIVDIVMLFFCNNRTRSLVY